MCSIKDTKDFILDTELVFKTDLLDKMNNPNIKIIKSQNKFCCIDFALINHLNLKCIYMEHKRKSINALNFDSFIINYHKLMLMDLYYENSIIVWECNDEVYFTLYNKDFLSLDKGVSYGQKIVNIPKKICGSGIENLILLIEKNILH